jgi:non-homologous end joining protein Ku
MSLEKNIKIADFVAFQKTEDGWFDAEEILLPMNLDSNTFDAMELRFDKSWDWITCLLGAWSHHFNRDEEKEYDVLCYDCSDAILENDLVRAYNAINLFIDIRKGVDSINISRDGIKLF